MIKKIKNRIVQRLKCFLLEHSYEMYAYFDSNFQKVKCGDCGKEFGVNCQLKILLPWDEDFEQMVKTVFPQHEYLTRNKKIMK